MTGKPHLTLVSVGCFSRARVCLDLRSETQIFVDPAAFPFTDRPKGACLWKLFHVLALRAADRLAFASSDS
jgi:hypothetical protein